jgi:hypothetical protein
MNYVNIFYPHHCVLSSKSEKPQNNKIVLYNYKCSAECYSDILVATRLMLLNDFKIINPTLNRLNKKSDIEWIFLTIIPLTTLKKLWNDEYRLNSMKNTIKFINDS